MQRLWLGIGEPFALGSGGLRCGSRPRSYGVSDVTDKLDEDPVVQYALAREKWERFTRLVEQHVRHLLEEHGVRYHAITSRTKSVESFRRKIEEKRYQDATADVMDRAGVRIIMHLLSECQPAEWLVGHEFEVVPEHSPNKLAELGTDRMGYRSTNIVCKPPRKLCRERRPWADYDGWPFEVQVRSLLDHAWAELSHARSYKLQVGALPHDLERRLSLLAAQLESCDRECDSIAADAQAYVVAMNKLAPEDRLDADINLVSLTAYFRAKLPELTITEPEPGDGVSAALLRHLGWRTLRDIDTVIPQDFGAFLNRLYSAPLSALAVLIDLLLATKPDAVLRPKSPDAKVRASRQSPIVRLMTHYGIDYSEYFDVGEE